MCLCGAIALIGCSHPTTGVVGSWRSSKLLVVFKPDKTWNVVGINMDSGTWDQSGSQVTLTPTKIQGQTQAQYRDKAKGGDATKHVQVLQQIDKAFSPFILTLDGNETHMKDPGGIVGDLTRQAS